MIYIITVALCVLFLLGTACRSARRSAEEEQQAAQFLRMQKEQREQERAQQMKAEQKQAAQAARKAAEDRKRQERTRRAEEAHALKVARAAELAELAERRLQAEREIAALRAARPDHASQEAEKPAAPVPSPEQSAPSTAPGPQPFAGQVVSFTGRLSVSGMTRAQAIEKVQQAGGKAYQAMPASTTILVVGDRPGMGKLDKADEWISHVRKITERQFLDMLACA